MTRPFDKHLDSDELDGLVSLQETSVSGPEQLSEPALREAQRHVESCQDCSRKLQRHKFVHSEILRMRVPNPSPPTPECMGDAEWLEVAAGLLPEAKTRELMKHAAQCGHCGPLLKNAAESIADEATPERGGTAGVTAKCATRMAEEYGHNTARQCTRPADASFVVAGDLRLADSRIRVGGDRRRRRDCRLDRSADIASAVC